MFLRDTKLDWSFFCTCTPTMPFGTSCVLLSTLHWEEIISIWVPAPVVGIVQRMCVNKHVGGCVRAFIQRVRPAEQGTETACSWGEVRMTPWYTSVLLWDSWSERAQERPFLQCGPLLCMHSYLIQNAPPLCCNEASESLTPSRVMVNCCWNQIWSWCSQRHM